MEFQRQIGQQRQSNKPLWDGFFPNLKWKTYDESPLLYVGNNRYEPLKNPITTWDDDQNHGIVNVALSESVRQRTKAWYDLRARFPTTISGSTIKDYVAFESEKARDVFYGNGGAFASHDSFVNAIKRTQSSKLDASVTGRMCMDWGTLHEDNVALALLAAKPSLVLSEAGVYKGDIDGLQFYVSPDGLYRLEGTQSHGTCEFKCKSPFLAFLSDDQVDVATNRGIDILYRYKRNSPERTIPCRYMLQIYLQMILTHSDESFFAQYTPTDGSNIMRIHRDKEYFHWATDLIKWAIEKYADVPAGEIPKAPFASCPLRYDDFLLRTKQLSSTFMEDLIHVDEKQYGFIFPKLPKMSSNKMWLDEMTPDVAAEKRKRFAEWLRLSKNDVAAFSDTQTRLTDSMGQRPSSSTITTTKFNNNNNNNNSPLTFFNNANGASLKRQRPLCFDDLVNKSDDIGDGGGDNNSGDQMMMMATMSNEQKDMKEKYDRIQSVVESEIGRQLMVAVTVPPEDAIVIISKK